MNNSVPHFCLNTSTWNLLSSVKEDNQAWFYLESPRKVKKKWVEVFVLENGSVLKFNWNKLFGVLYRKLHLASELTWLLDLLRKQSIVFHEAHE